MPIQNQTYIFLPMLVVVALTFVAFVRMAVGRTAAVKGGQDPAFYRAHLGAPEPEATVVTVRHYGNLFELPTLFYAACLTAYLLGGVTAWALGWANAYAAARVVQSAVHLTYNKPAHRGLAFIVGMVCMIALWIVIALEIFTRF